MITFNDLLLKGGLDLKKVKLARHQDNHGSDRRRRPYYLWQAGDGRFEQYQRTQAGLPFKYAAHLAAFVVSPANETIFVGLYDIGPTVGLVPSGMIDPVRQTDVGGLNFYDLTHNTVLAEYEGRVVVEWGSPRPWVQKALGDAKPKPILEMRRAVHEEQFPGLMEFRRPIDELDTMPMSWRTVLSDVRGVYLLACRKTGKAYVGSAYGEDGFLGRWLEYAASGDGGNVGMRAHEHRDWQVSILEVAASSATMADIVAMESSWKAKLLSLEFGLNQN